MAIFWRWKGVKHTTIVVWTTYVERISSRHTLCSAPYALTYPELEDASQTKTRESIRGLQSNIVFIDHGHPEEDEKRTFDRADGSSLFISKHVWGKGGAQNSPMPRTARLWNWQHIVLTPYLGQLSLLRDAFKSEIGTSLSDLDSNDLYRAGLLGNSGSHKKTGIRPATIGTRYSTRRIVG